jgi:ribulose-5-phosphate 4-epimerase/fuculose-1-phosphate aldolase
VGRRPFLITGTQTGGVADAGPAHFTTVQRCAVGDGFVESEGPSAPSSEAMTHAAMYGVDEHLRFVFHVHSVEIWRHARRLELPVTPPEVEYGTTQMAWAVEKLLQQRRTREAGAIAMLGHEDGVITFGETPEQAGEAMMRWLARARALPAGHC